jgi:O-antigen/teichoic acid export membrane protein
MNFLKSFSIYTFSGLIGKAVAFMLLPFFTHYLTQSDYGVISIFSNSIYFIAPFMGLGIGETFSVEYPRLTREETSKFISTSLVFPIVIFVLCTVLLLPFGSFFQSRTGLSQHLLFLVILLSVFNFFTDYIFIILRNQNRPVFFAGVSLFKTIIELLLAIVFIKYLHQGAMGRVNSLFFTSLLCFLFVLAYFLKIGVISLSFSKEWLMTILHRGLPTIPLFFMIFVLGNADKYMINYYYGNDAMGVYGLAWQFAMIVALFTTAFATPFYPFLYQNLANREYEKAVKVTGIYILALIAGVLLLLGVIPFVFKIMIAPKFHGSIKYIPYMLFGQVFWALFIILCGYIYYKKNNRVFYYISPLVIIVTLLINYIFLVAYPVKNFAFVSFASYLFCFLLGAFVLRGDIKRAFSYIQKNKLSLI